MMRIYKVHALQNWMSYIHVVYKRNSIITVIGHIQEGTSPVDLDVILYSFTLLSKYVH